MTKKLKPRLSTQKWKLLLFQKKKSDKRPQGGSEIAQCRRLSGKVCPGLGMVNLNSIYGQTTDRNRTLANQLGIFGIY